MKSTYTLEKLIEEISYRTQRCEEAWNEGDPLKRFSEFKAFIFSIGSAMDIVRVHVFFDFPPIGNKYYFKDLFGDKQKNISDSFIEHLEGKIADRRVKDSVIEALDKIRKIFFDERYEAFLRENPHDKKYFSLWQIYNSLKHTSIPKESYIKALFTDSIIGTSGDIMIEIFDDEHLYEIHFPGKPVAPEGIKPEDLGYSSENQTLVWIEALKQEVVNFLETLKNTLTCSNT